MLQLQNTNLGVFLQQSGRKIKKTHGDGNCLFRCFSFFLFGREGQHLTVRSILMRVENLNKEVFEGKLTDLNEPSIREHVHKLLRPNTWGTHVEIMAAATYFQVPVYFCYKNTMGIYKWDVVKPLCPLEKLRLPDLTGMFADIPPKPDDLPPLTHFELLYHSNVHYDCVVSHSGYLCDDLPTLNAQEIYLDEIL